MKKIDAHHVVSLLSSRTSLYASYISSWKAKGACKGQRRWAAGAHSQRTKGGGHRERARARERESEKERKTAFSPFLLCLVAR